MRTPKGFVTLVALFGLALVVGSAEAVVNIQNVGAGARSSALGNSFVAVADDADAVFFNPAGVGQMKQRQLAYTNVSLFFGGIDGDDLGQHVVSYVQSLGSRLGVGLGYERIGSDLMSENGAFLSLGYRLSDNLSVGVNGKYLFWSVGEIPNDPVSGAADPLSDASSGALGVDVGVLWKTPIAGAQVGVMVKNVNQPNVAKDSVPGDSDAGALPMDLSVGVSYRLRGLSMVSVEWVGRDVSGDEMDSRVVVGGETQLVENLMLRAGGSKLFQEDASGDLNAGLGYSWNQVLFDYGYHIPLDMMETNGAHRFSFAYNF
jgi:hypothetical protein